MSLEKRIESIEKTVARLPDAVRAAFLEADSAVFDAVNDHAKRMAEWVDRKEARERGPGHAQAIHEAYAINVLCALLRHPPICELDARLAAQKAWMTADAMMEGWRERYGAEEAKSDAVP